MKSQASPVALAFQNIRLAFVGIAVISCVINLLMLTGPLFMLQVYDRVLASHSVPTLVVLAAITGMLYLFYGILEGIRSRALSRLSQKLDALLTGDTFNAQIRLPLKTGAQGKALNPIKDLEQMRHFWGGQGPSAIFDMPWMPIYLAFVFIIHPWLGWMAVAGTIIIIILMITNDLIAKSPAQKLSGTAARRDLLAAAAKRNAEVMRAMGMTSNMAQRWQSTTNDFYEANQSAGDRASLVSTLVRSFRLILQSAILGFGAWLAILQKITPGEMIAATIITSRALAPVEIAVAHWRSFVAARQSSKRLSDYLQSTIQFPPDINLPLPRHNITVENMFSAAPGEKSPTVQGVNFSLSAGEGLGIIGPSGCGKTSLIRALVGVWPVLRGSVRIDGATIDQWDEHRIGKSIGYLPQDVELFDGTISENIARFDPEKTTESVIEAAKIANVHELITSLPKGYDTEIGEGGKLLSAGQRQRVGLARALYGKPFLVILDEPNSNLDNEGEGALTTAIKEIRSKGSIVILVAHRPSAIAAIDKLLLLKDGKQVTLGPKEEVLKKLMGSRTTETIQQRASS